VSNADQFRKDAEEARQMAARSTKQEDKAFWLRLAEDWNKLAQEADKNEDRDGTQRPGILS
jgi:hypothetical protein